MNRWPGCLLVLSRRRVITAVPEAYLMNPDSAAPIGVFDSGVGGLSVLAQIHKQFPAENLLYVADQAHVPYGPRSLSEVQQFSAAITRFLLAQNARLIVVACNTASAAALNTLRRAFPDVVFVGMEPAVKPAARATKTGKVGVLATTGTFASERYAALMTRFAHDVVVYEDPCLGLVELIEAGEIDSPPVRALLRQVVTPMLAAGVDTLVLGCTHYPFVLPTLRQIVGTAVSLIDPAPAVARQVGRVLQASPVPAESWGRVTLLTSGGRPFFRRRCSSCGGCGRGENGRLADRSRRFAVAI
ncbi:MAG: glutamate racemase [Chloroflexi bacterium]|nr:glutamate racemase [Chloroflexota bacterium]